MKNYIVLGLLLSSSLMAAPLPEELKCTSHATSEAVRSFSLTGLGTTKPDSTVFDTGLMGFEIRDGRLFMGLSNECDNSYDVELSLREIEEMMEGKRKTVTGKLTYSDVPLMEARNAEEAIEETVEITCKR